MTYLSGDDYINYNNGSQHPFRGGGLYLGRIVAVDSAKRGTVKIPSLGLTIQACPTMDSTSTKFLNVGDSVICAFLENDNQEVVIIGRINLSLDVYATKTEFAALANTVQSLEARISALESQ